MLDVDAQGLDVMDRKFLEAILHKFSGAGYVAGSLVG